MIDNQLNSCHKECNQIVDYYVHIEAWKTIENYNKFIVFLKNKIDDSDIKCQCHTEKPKEDALKTRFNNNTQFTIEECNEKEIKW